MKTIRMKKADWEKWDAALRSGQYEQGFGRLLTENGAYCCLGVLQHCLTGEVEMERDNNGNTVGARYPSRTWLDTRGIAFKREEGAFGAMASPYLESLSCKADKANDDGYTFFNIADAIKDAVEFTDA